MACRDFIFLLFATWAHRSPFLKYRNQKTWSIQTFEYAENTLNRKNFPKKISLLTEKKRKCIKFPVNFVTKEDIDNPYHPIKTVLRLCESVILDGNGYSVSPNRFPQARCANGVYVDCFLSIASMMGHGQHLSGLLFKDLDCGQ